MSDLVVYRNGLVHCSVCVPADMGRPDVEALVNAENPANPPGRTETLRWAIDESETFSGGQRNPCVCENDPSRLHYLMAC